MKSNNSAFASQIDELLRGQTIERVVDDFGSTEDNFAGLDNLESDPMVYTPVEIDGAAKELCVSDEAGVFNKLANSRLLMLTLDASTTVNFDVRRISGNDLAIPGLYIFDRGVAVTDAIGTDPGILDL